MRIGIAQLWQETNTFNPIATTRDDFEAFGVLRGEQIIDQLADTNEPGGFIQSLRAWPERPSPIGLVRLPAWPSGVATADTFAWLRDEILADLLEATARRMPDKTALVDGLQSLTYAELDRAASRAASRLTEAGIGPGG